MKMSYYEIPAIILGGDVTALAMSRNLGVNHVKVLHVSQEKNEVAYSKHCQKQFIIPDIEKRKELLREFLLETKKIIEDRAVVFPCSFRIQILISQRIMKKLKKLEKVLHILYLLSLL